MRTPWGESDYEKVYGDGITFYGTPGHGGFKLSAERLRKIHSSAFSVGDECFRLDRAKGWFEEDCDWSFVAVAFPHIFTPEQLSDAQAILRGTYGIEIPVIKSEGK